jgi:diaminopimelate epimerase
MNSPTMNIPFTKASACGNDFLIVEGVHAPADLAKISRELCDRHNGVGADGVEWLFPATDADVHARLFNADGSEAEISGNGTRCVAAYLCAEHPKEVVVIRTGAGLKTCSLSSHHATEYEFAITMGEPKIGAELPLHFSFGEVCGIPVSMGNPHYVSFVSEFLPGWQERAAQIGHFHEFKQGMNVELVSVINRSNIEVRFFERGVGETQSSGTGSCASAVAAISSGMADSPLRVHAPGGIQSVRWEGQVFLTGAARLVCRGEFFLPI